MITLMVLNCLLEDPTACRIEVNANTFYLEDVYCEAAIPNYVEWLSLNRPDMFLSSYTCHDWGEPL